ncbi:MAG: DNA-processing protein DprA [Candidatus Calescibacterium sp.]|jgi:DNA processing protein|nr:DNA-processing protein DprA [Candidatus Calescibacterium sp.]
MDLEIAFYSLALTKVRGVGSIIGKRLIDFFGSAKNIFSADKVKIEQAAGKFVAENIKKFSKWREVEEEIKLAQKLNQKIVCYEEKEKYPALLRNIPDPPICIFYKGELEKDMLCVAIVGTRSPSQYGIEVTKLFSSFLSSMGICIVSGLALGIDTVAHKSVVDVGGKTWAVLGSSVENIYPQSNAPIAKEILNKGGAIMSEFPPGVPPAPENFPRRNRIIAGISKAVLIAEAPEKSGALITAYLALEYGRDVFAVPGNITSKKSKGTNKLIKEGAFVAESPDDIISRVVPQLGQKVRDEKIGFVSPFIAYEIKRQDISDEEEKILSVLDEETPIHIDDIIKRTGLDPSQVLSTLISLELKSLVVEEGMGYYKKPPSS